MLPALRWLGRQEWLRPGLRYRAIRVFCDPERVASYAFEERIGDVRYPGNLNCFIDWKVFFFGMYEKQEVGLLRTLLQQFHDPVFMDVGANIGHHSMLLARCARTVHAFEPYDAVRERLESRLALNRIENVVVHPIGLGTEAALLDYFAPQGANSGTGSFVATHEAGNNALLGRLRVEQGDAYMATKGISALHLIKIDVEGFEKQVLTGLRQTLVRFRPVIFMEFSPDTRSSFRDFVEFRGLLPPAYSVWTVQSHKPVGVLFCRPGARLTAFDFDTRGTTNLLLVPDELDIRRFT